MQTPACRFQPSAETDHRPPGCGANARSAGSSGRAPRALRQAQGDCPALHRGLPQTFERTALHRIPDRAGILRVNEVFAPQPPQAALADAVQHLGQLLAGRRRRSAEEKDVTGATPEYPVQEEAMEMDVKVDRTARSLLKYHRSAAPDAAEPPPEVGEDRVR